VKCILSNVVKVKENNIKIINGNINNETNRFIKRGT